MAKRFCDTEIWDKAWFQELSLKEKILVKYIFEQCDCAGVWDINFRLASFIIGEKVSINDIDSVNEKNLLFEVFDTDKIFVIDFIKFQYGTLSENCKPHKPIIEKLKKYNLFERVSKGYPKGIETLEEKEKEKEQYKEKEIEKSIDPYFSTAKTNFQNEWQKVFEEKPYLQRQHCYKLIELEEDIENFREILPDALQKLKRLKFEDIDFNPRNADWLLRDCNFSKLMNGAFDNQLEVKRKSIEEILAEIEEKKSG